MTQFLFPCTDRKDWVRSTLKVELLAELKFEPGFRCNWRIIVSQIDSNILKLIGIPGRILVPPVTQLFRSKWLHFFFRCDILQNLSQKIKSKPLLILNWRLFSSKNYADRIVIEYKYFQNIRLENYSSGLLFLRLDRGKILGRVI